MECCARVLMALSSQPSGSVASRGSTAAARTSAGSHACTGAAAVSMPARKRPAAAAAPGGPPAPKLPAAWVPALPPAVLLSIGGRPFGVQPCSDSRGSSSFGSSLVQVAVQNAPHSMHSNALPLPGDLREEERRMTRIDESGAAAVLRWAARTTLATCAHGWRDACKHHTACCHGWQLALRVMRAVLAHPHPGWQNSAGPSCQRPPK